MQTALKKGDDDSWHEWRKRVKDLWYALRILKPVAVRPALGSGGRGQRPERPARRPQRPRRAGRDRARVRGRARARPRRAGAGRAVDAAATACGWPRCRWACACSPRSPRRSRAGSRASGRPASPSSRPTPRGCRPSWWPRSGASWWPRRQAPPSERRKISAALPGLGFRIRDFAGARPAPPGRLLGRRLRPAGGEGHHPRGRRRPRRAAWPRARRSRPATAARPRPPEPEPDPEPEAEPQPGPTSEPPDRRRGRPAAARPCAQRPEAGLRRGSLGRRRLRRALAARLRPAAAALADERDRGTLPGSRLTRRRSWRRTGRCARQPKSALPRGRSTAGVTRLPSPAEGAGRRPGSRSRWRRATKPKSAGHPAGVSPP